ncbi:MAG: response regulator [Clostridiaceae bacterium]|nr:response regulator [Clostridiaceae bacterium]
MYRVVLIDDEPWVLSGLEELIDWNKSGFTIVAKFTDPEVALEQIIRIRPDVIFTDIRMPKMSGVQLTASLKENNIDSEIVFISAYRDFEAARKALEYGACQYILKPFDQNEVENAIRLLNEKIKKRNRPVSINPDEPDNLISAETEQLFRTAARYPICCLVLCDHPNAISFDQGLVTGTPLLIKGEPAAFLLSAKTKEYIHLLTSSIKPEPLNGVGFSRLYSDFTTFPEMLNDAKCSLNFGFIFSKNPLAAEIQLFLCSTVSTNLTLTDLASEFYLSETYLSAMFKKNTGRTITNFIQDIKTFYAARLLLTTDLDLKDIALQLGYTDYSYFGRLFKRNYGVSPSLYREKINRDSYTTSHSLRDVSRGCFGTVSSTEV